MAFNNIEISNDDGKPIALYEFARVGKVWRYTTADQNIIFGNVTYLAVPGSDNGITQSGDSDTDTLQITLPYDADVCKQYERTPTSDEVRVIIRRMHFEDDEAPVIWVGSVTGYSRPDIVSRVFSCNTLSISFTMGGLRLAWGRNCPHMLYDRNCTIDKALFAVPTTAVIADAQTLTIVDGANFPDDYFSGGFAEWEIEPGVFERRGITSHLATQFILFGTSDWFTSGGNIVLYPGCNRIIQTCNDKFNNLPNYGGFANLPGKSPFDGNPVF